MRQYFWPGFSSRHLDGRGRWAAAALFATLFLGGCSLLPGPLDNPLRDQEEALFLQGLDKLPTTTGPSKAFTRLSAEFPDSPWTARARSIEKLREQLQKEQRERSLQQKRLEEIRQEKDRLAADVRSCDELQKGLDACRVERDRLASDVRSLEKYILRLKSLLAESGIVEPALPAR